jgi:hypothetical protein
MIDNSGSVRIIQEYIESAHSDWLRMNCNSITEKVFVSLHYQDRAPSLRLLIERKGMQLMAESTVSSISSVLTNSKSWTTCFYEISVS